LFRGVHIRGLARHKVQEAVELDEAGSVGIHDGEDALEVDLALLVLAHGVAQRDQAVLELLGVQPTSSKKEGELLLNLRSKSADQGLFLYY
jgi:hypothetical protein